MNYDYNAWWQVCRRYNRQQTCTHLKGLIGRNYRTVPTKDYNIAMHTFNTGETKIWCLNNCGWHVWNTPDYSYKWAHGLKMVNLSTNIRSMSEVSNDIALEKRQVNSTSIGAPNWYQTKKENL